jgi:hypothetical protein
MILPFSSIQIGVPCMRASLRATLAARRSARPLCGGEIRPVVKQHDLVGAERQHGVSSAVAIGEFYFACAVVIDPHDRSDLTPVQQQGLAAFEMLYGLVFKQRHNVVLFSLSGHDQRIFTLAAIARA